MTASREGGEIFLWDLAKKTSQQLEGDQRQSAIAFSPSGEWLAMGGSEGKVYLWRISKGKVISHTVLQSAFKIVLDVSFSPDNKTLAAAGAVAPVRVWDLSTLSTKDLGEPTETRRVGFSLDGALLVSVGLATKPDVYIWDTKTWEQKTMPEGLEGGALSFSPDGTRLGIFQYDGEVSVLDLATQTYRSLPAHDRTFSAVILFSPDGSQIATQGQDGRVFLFDDSLPQEPGSLRGAIDAALQKY